MSFEFTAGLGLDTRVELALGHLCSLFHNEANAVPVRAEMMNALARGVDADPCFMTVAKKAFDDVDLSPS